ncbi:alpha-L-rhamnosidase [Chloroflexus islandicus]|uniref:Alpha-L-rhamnosidase n=1 Tax=Chloroflexus islandicus TaxID=1707952 RepID=A0A178M5N8_9CHLR|nr:family 78 glycoside hydrolase catalytic domain [Chloroflexus islandicus]OAN42865.1 alpha-L-rhamnosidase [Chloroflexus islandicus]
MKRHVAILLFTLLITLWPLPTQSASICFCDATPIWVHANPPAAHEVALFRLEVNLAVPAPATTLAIFADTRYEAYLNGQLLGRGPARFSRALREYDQLAIGDLPAGRQVFTVRVQWAPNTRRSDSERPFLWALLRSNGQPLASTGPHWQAQLLHAYRSDAAPVHRWGLIGPTEIVDLAMLAPDWVMNGGASGWQPAVAVTAQPAPFTPRSIPQLVEVAIPIRSLQAGWLAPGFTPIEFPGGVDQASVQIQTQRSAILTLISLQGELTNRLTINGQSLNWQAMPNRPPGIVTAAYQVAAGKHTLRLSGLHNQPEGWTVLLSRNDLVTVPAVTPTSHAGRRVLLATPQPDAQAVLRQSDQPLTLHVQPPASYAILDLGRTVHGRLYADVAGPAGAIVDIGWDERLWQHTIPLPFPGTLHPEWNQVDSWRLDGRSHSISTIDARAGRYVLIAVWSNEPVVIRNLRVSEERYPVRQIGSFTSNDPLLNQIWQVGVDSLYPNMTDAYTDTPWRERGQWWGDAYVSDHVNQAAFGDRGLLQRGLRQLAGEFTPEGAPVAMAPHIGGRMLDYGMLWVQAIADDLRRTNDPALASELWPTMTRFLNYLATYRRNDTGLLDLPAGHWSQTTYLDSSVTVARYGQSTPVNAMYYGTLRAAAAIATALGETEAAHRWESEAALLRNRINQYLYDQPRRHYITTVINGQPIAAGPHAQAFALAYDLVPPTEISAVADALLNLISRDLTRPNLQLYGMSWALEGLQRAGRINEAIQLIKEFYGWQLAQGATTWWENVNANLQWGGSLSHSWSGSPTWFLTTAILGARQTGPTTWEVDPAWQGVSSAAGILPLPTGSLRVEWEQPDCELRRVTIEAPNDTHGNVWLPPPVETTVITLNGITIWTPETHNSLIQQTNDGRLRLSLTGEVSYTIEQRCTCKSIWLPVISRS